jgi:hypothetical protein
VPAGNRLHGDERRVFGDAGYLGIQKRDEHKDRKNVSWFIAPMCQRSCRLIISEDNHAPLFTGT